jgi:uncharacterized phage infection (PIP) family protein YhgE
MRFFIEIFQLPSFIVLPFVFTTIIYWMANLSSDVWAFLTCAAIIILVAQTAVSFGNFKLEQKHFKLSS